MKIGIYHPFTHLPDNYSLSHVVKEQMLMILEEGWECHFVTHQNFSAQVPEGVTIHDVLPSRNGKAIESSCREIIETLDRVLTHDVAYLSVYADHAAAIRRIATDNPDIKWLHWAHSAPNPREKKDPIPNSIYIGMNYTDLMLLAEQFQVPVAKCRVVYNPVSPDVWWDWHQETKDFVEKHELLDCDILMTYPLDMGRFEAKGGDDIMALVDMLNVEGKNAKVVFINAAANTKNRKELAESLNQNPHAIFTSIETPVWDVTAPRWFVRELMQISDIFPLLSRSEGCSLTMLEAGLSGNLLLINEDFPPMMEFANVDEAYRLKLSSDRQTTSYNPSKIKYLNDWAMNLINEMDKNKVLRFRRKVLKRFNRKWIMENQLKPLLE